MPDHKQTVDFLADIMKEYGLAEAKIRCGEVEVGFREVELYEAEGPREVFATSSYLEPVAAPEVPVGTPLNSPMNGIYYSAPSPNSSPFVKEGDSVTAGQVVGLIEAMKVFNEITATVSGTVVRLCVESGQVVQPGDTLMLIS